MTATFSEDKVRRSRDGKFANQDLTRDDAGQLDVGLEPDFGSLPGARRYSTLDRTERLDAIKEDLQSSINEIVESGELGNYLDTMARSRIGNWSFNNQFLAHMQLAGVREALDDDHPYKFAAPVVMSAGAWKREYGAVPRKGTKAMWILAPTTRTIEEEDDDGKATKRVVTTGFRPQAEFDISQMEGDLPDATFYDTEAATGEVAPGVYSGLKDRIEQSGYEFSEQEIPGSDPAHNQGKLGYTTMDNKVVVDSRCTPAQKVAVMAHELAHIKCGHTKDFDKYREHRGRMETEAEATAYMVMRATGSEREQHESFSARYIAGWSKGDSDTVQKALNVSTKAFNEIMDGEWSD